MTDDPALARKLNSLEALHADGTLSDAEYQAARSRVIARHAEAGPTDEPHEEQVLQDGEQEETPWSTVRINLPPEVPTGPAPGTDASWQPYALPDSPQPEEVSPDYGALPPAPAGPSQFPGLPGYQQLPGPAPTSAAESAGGPVPGLAPFQPMPTPVTARRPLGLPARVWWVLGGLALAALIVAVWLVALRGSAEAFTGGDVASQSAPDEGFVVGLGLDALRQPVWGTPAARWRTRIDLDAGGGESGGGVVLVDQSADDETVAVLVGYGAGSAAVDGPRQILVMDRGSGSVRWTTPLVDADQVAQVEVADGTVITHISLPRSTGDLVGFDAEEGTIRWAVASPSSGIVLEHHPTAGLLARAGGVVWAIDPREGAQPLIDADDVWLGTQTAVTLTERPGGELLIQVRGLDQSEPQAEFVLPPDARPRLAGVADQVIALVTEGGPVILHDFSGRQIGELPSVGRGGPNLNRRTDQLVGFGRHLLVGGSAGSLIYDAEAGEVVVLADGQLLPAVMGEVVYVFHADGRLAEVLGGEQPDIDGRFEPFAAGQFITAAAAAEPGADGQTPRTAHTPDGARGWTVQPPAGGARWGFGVIDRGILIGTDDLLSLYE